MFIFSNQYHFHFYHLLPLLYLRLLQNPQSSFGVASMFCIPLWCLWWKYEWLSEILKEKNKPVLETNNPVIFMGGGVQKYSFCLLIPLRWGVCNRIYCSSFFKMGYIVPAFFKKVHHAQGSSYHQFLEVQTRIFLFCRVAFILSCCHYYVDWNPLCWEECYGLWKKNSEQGLCTVSSYTTY